MKPAKLTHYQRSALAKLRGGKWIIGDTNLAPPGTLRGLFVRGLVERRVVQNPRSTIIDAKARAFALIWEYRRKSK